MSHKIYPIGIQNFEKIRNDGYFYIDKTALMYQMVKTGSYYFLSRPRRFGKSLLVSTLEAYFQGKKELFEGLAVEKLEKDWIKYPILHLDLNIEKYDTDIRKLFGRESHHLVDESGKHRILRPHDGITDSGAHHRAVETAVHGRALQAVVLHRNPQRHKVTEQPCRYICLAQQPLTACRYTA